jgi:hypothetical protein
MKVTKQDIELVAYGYNLLIPAGTQTTHNTAMGIDYNYNFVLNTSDVLFKWSDEEEYIKVNHKEVPILYDDIHHYGINIPAEMIEEL